MGIFNKNKEELKILKQTQENLDITQKNICAIVDKLSCIVEKPLDTEIENTFTEEEKIRAAYALNLCTVSISQIIDYNDINILEQEYDAILNNLNLEYIPKDEALLNTLKLLLDTITFFRIQEGDKQFIEKEYQEKVKNAIWSAVPNIGLIITSGNPKAIALSLASQVGCGYMNYRKNKAQNILDKEKAEWQLQRSAIEQFNGIRRELFDTAWRLADKYKFSDKYRLTERKIKQYNNILMDPDDYRRFERLDTIKDNFYAYPPFWYFFGNTANSIAQKELEVGAKTYYKKLAKEYFETYLKVNRYGLLREDKVLASCCLEYIDLLDINDNKDKIYELLEKAVEVSGDFNDILQLCSLYYLKIGNTKKSEELLRNLVNEDYNTTLNSQILSSIYVLDYINNKSETAKYNYERLENKVNSQILFPISSEDATTFKELHEKFIEKQREILLEKYDLVLIEFKKKYNRLFPIPDLDSNNRYVLKLNNEDISFDILDSLNKMMDAICYLNCIKDIDELSNNIKDKIVKNKDELNKVQKRIDENKNCSIESNTLKNITFGCFTETFFKKIDVQVLEYIIKKNTMSDISYAEQNLREFCLIEKILEPELLYRKSLSYNSLDEIRPKYFDVKLLGEEANTYKIERDSFKKMTKIIEEVKQELIFNNNENTFLYFKGDNGFESYINKNSKKIGLSLRQKTIAIIEDKRFKHKDIIFTNTGIILTGPIYLKAEVRYTDIDWYDNSNTSLNINDKFKNNNINLEKMYGLIKELAKFTEIEDINT